MSRRLDALAVRPYTDRHGEEKTAFTKVGAAFETKNGGWQVLLDAVPVAQDGQVKILLMEPTPKQSGGYDQSARNQSSDLDDEIPF